MKQVKDFIKYSGNIKFYYDLFNDLFMLNNKTDISKSINPINSEDIESKVNGIEKYLVSLNVEIIITEKIIPIIKKIIPNIPKYFNG